MLWGYYIFGTFLTLFNFSRAQRGVYFFQIVKPSHLKYTYEIRLARDIGVDFSGLLKSIRLVRADPAQSCSQLVNSDESKDAVVLVERGGCSFLSKAIEVEKAGGLAVMVTDCENGDDLMVEMIKDETGRSANIPAVYLPGNHGRILRQHYLYGNSIVLIDIPLNLTMTPLEQVRKPPWDLW